jgi:hypothetical protein
MDPIRAGRDRTDLTGAFEASICVLCADRSGSGPVRHYHTHSGAAGRAPSPGFDGKLDLSVYPDVRDAGVHLLHFMKWGAKKGGLTPCSLIVRRQERIA